MSDGLSAVRALYVGAEPIAYGRRLVECKCPVCGHEYTFKSGLTQDKCIHFVKLDIDSDIVIFDSERFQTSK